MTDAQSRKARLEEIGKHANQHIAVPSGYITWLLAELAKSDALIKEMAGLMGEAAEELESEFVGGGPRCPAEDSEYAHWRGKFACDGCGGYEGWSTETKNIHKPDCLVTKLRTAADEAALVAKQEG